VIESSDKKNVYHPVFVHQIDPSDVNIIYEGSNPNDRVYEALKNGDPHNHVDLAWIGEGYSAAQYDLFKADVDRYVEFFFSIEPYKSHKDKFNVFGVFRASPESGVDQPTKGIFKRTSVHASFNALVEKQQKLIKLARRIASKETALLSRAAIWLDPVRRVGT